MGRSGSSMRGELTLCAATTGASGLEQIGLGVGRRLDDALEGRVVLDERRRIPAGYRQAQLARSITALAAAFPSKWLFV